MTYEEQKAAIKLAIEAFASVPCGEILPSVWKVPEGYVLEKYTLHHVPTEHLIPPKSNGKVIYLLHGGGFVTALSDMYREAAVHYSKMAGDAEIFMIDYRIAPTDQAPAALEDAVLVYQWILEKGYHAEDIVFVGDSAGGNLVLTTTLFLKDNSIPLPKGIIALSPWTCIQSTYPSMTENREKDLLLGTNGLKIASEVYNSRYFQNSDLKDAYNSPAYGDYTGFPSLLIIAGSYEVLRDDSSAVAEAAKKAGVDVKHIIYEGQSHAFPLSLAEEEASKKAWKEMQLFMNKVFQ
ncbi:alpha/beta hydrolase [[Clostridium] polysaccharolyticum]|uniref:Acetyl esterase/lipase n=1 Tax=[Clostridium] polysaccharolyticum TaxID=29364 RepID=A0A1H9ZFK1_9FIRM|nr:alpha/beta hydrolase [[Clostridium] polysaccharolyticum]SES80312.1 Acetyl esterase/lipase [[Clostridium] polysaccharolyticum]